jgi:ComF family protein
MTEEPVDEAGDQPGGSLRGFADQAARILAPFVSFVFPPACLCCNTALESPSAILCAACWGALEPLDFADARYLRTFERITRNGVIDGLAAPYYFQEEGPLQALVHELKYKGMTRVGTELGLRLAGRIRDAFPGSEPAVIIPVPLHPTKLRERGYNQAECIARGMAGALGIPVCPCIVRRVRYTQSQTHLDAEQRENNVAEAFTIAANEKRRLEGTTVYLVDDVITTGATIRSCARTVKGFGEKRIVACAAGVAVRPDQGRSAFRGSTVIAEG